MRIRSFTFMFAGLALVLAASAMLSRRALARLPDYNLVNSTSGAATRNAVAHAAALKQEEWARLDDEAWQKIQPELIEWGKKGKPVITKVMQVEDLPQADIPAFPGAEGGGMYSFGGRGGRVFVVSSLEDDGPGTLREACQAAGPRIIVFGVAGIIHLKRPIEVNAPYMTVDGHTAPGDGVCIAGQSFEVNTHDVVLRYMRFRRGITEYYNRDDALGGDPLGNVIVDHCSCSWGLDETLSMYRHMQSPPNDDNRDHRIKLPTFNLTVQWTIITEGLNTYNHAFGGTWGGRNSMFHHNLLASNTGRNCSIGMGYDFNLIDNVIFNWRHRTVDGGDDTSRVNIINNYYKPGPVTQEDVDRRIALIQSWTRHPDPTRRYGKWYIAGNYMVGDEEVTADNWNGGVDVSTEEAPSGEEITTNDQTRALIPKIRVDHPFPMAPVTIQPAEESYELVLDHAGACLPRRDPVDERAVNQTRTGKVQYKQGIITDISQVGGYPEYKGDPITYTQNDGIPDWWKKKYNLDLKDPNLATEDCNGDGYTNIEKYLDGIDPSKKVDWKDLKNNVNPLDSVSATTQPAAQ
jgi:hypothetical protein